MIALKTAALVVAAAQMGAVVAGAPQEDCKALDDMGIELGLAFQIQDDYLDTYGTPEILGKAIGDDIAEAKKTFLAINALNDAGAATRRALLATFADRKLPLSHKMGRVKTIYDSLDIPEITRNIIAEHLARAAQLLDGLSMQEGNKAPYMELIKTLENRNK